VHAVCDHPRARQAIHMDDPGHSPMLQCFRHSIHQEARMRVQSVWLALSAAAIVTLSVAASEKAPDSYIKNMKDTNAAAQELRKNLDTKDYDAVAKQAATLKTLFETTQKFWEDRKADDAVTVAKNAIKAASDLETAAKAKNDEGVAAAAKVVQGSCKSCHDAHRERLPDGSSEIK
jgi:cytochrome c556